MKERYRAKWDTQQYTASEQKKEMAQLELTLKQMFPLAYEINPAEVATKLPGKEIPRTFDWDLVIPILEQAIEDPRAANLDLYKEMKDYLDFRNQVIIGVQKGKNFAIKEDAVNWIRTTNTEEAQQVRDLLYKKGSLLSQETPEFLPVFQDVFYNEVTKYGIGDLSDE